MIRKYITKPLRDLVKKKIKNIYIEIEAQNRKEHYKIPSLFFPYLKDADSFVITNKNEMTEHCELGLPVPPESLWLGYASNTEDYLLPGKRQVNSMLEIIKGHGFKFEGKKRVLDFGCGAGRMIRWLEPLADRWEIWGTDISSEHIFWANKYLKPPFNFATTTTIPHLPFEDRYFDLIYAGSVFTHIDDLADSWLLEIRRILSDEGYLYITIHDKETLSLLNSRPQWREGFIAKLLEENPLIKKHGEDFDMFVMLRGPESQVFYDIDYFKKAIKNIFDVLSVTPGSYGYQTGVLLKKRK